MEQRTEELLNLVLRRRDASHRQVVELQKKFADAQDEEALWSDLAKFIENDWPAHLANLFHRRADLLKTLRSGGDESLPALEELFKQAREDARHAQARFPAAFEEACQNAGLVVDQGSRHPKYTFEQGFLRLTVDDGRMMASLENHERPLIELPSDAAAIAAAVRREHQRLFGRAFDGKLVLGRLRKAYLNAAARDGRPDGDAVPIRLITRRVKNNFREFLVDEFLVDLARLVQQGPLEIDGRRLDLQQTKDISEGVLLPGLSSGGYVGFVLFRKV